MHSTGPLCTVFNHSVRELWVVTEMNEIADTSGRKRVFLWRKLTVEPAEVVQAFD